MRLRHQLGHAAESALPVRQQGSEQRDPFQGWEE